MNVQSPPKRANGVVDPRDGALLKRKYPTILDVRRLARRRAPHFAFEYCDGGAGEDGGIAKNWAALDAIDMVPRYGKLTAPPPTEATLFGRRYAAPVGIAPMGGPSVVWPGADQAFARAAQRLKIPYVAGLMAGISVEQAAELAPDVFWFQLYRLHRNEHKLGFDMVRRAHEAGAHVLVITFDGLARTVRTREVKAGIVNPFKLTWKLRYDAIMAPRWLFALRRHGMTRFENFKPYLPSNLTFAETARAVRQEASGSAFTWDEIARYRDKWKRPLVLKGVLHPEDAERAVQLGLDGIVVSNHGGRQIEALPATADVLPAIIEQVNGRLSVLFDSGVRSGYDVARAIALGADGALAGKAFMWGLGALGDEGPGHVGELLIEEMGAALGQLGCEDIPSLRKIAVRRPRSYRLNEFAPSRPAAPQPMKVHVAE